MKFASLESVVADRICGKTIPSSVRTQDPRNRRATLGKDGSRRANGRPGLGDVCIMLVLSRKKNESIVIDERIVITVVEIRGDKVRLGIEAPREVPVHRSEVHAAIQSEHAAATPAAPPPSGSVGTTSLEVAAANPASADA